MADLRPVTAEIRTDRLLMRRFTDADRTPFAEMNADPDVMKHFPSTMTRQQTDAFVDTILQRFDPSRASGCGRWSDRTTASSSDTRASTRCRPVCPGTAGSRLVGGLRRTPGATATRPRRREQRSTPGFGTHRLDRVYSMTAVTNVRSTAVMRRLGMTHQEDFDHPALEIGSPLRHHVLYTLAREDWHPSAEPCTARLSPQTPRAMSSMIEARSCGRDHIGQWLVGRSTHVTSCSSARPPSQVWPCATASL